MCLEGLSPTGGGMPTGHPTALGGFQHIFLKHMQQHDTRGGDPGARFCPAIPAVAHTAGSPRGPLVGMDIANPVLRCWGAFVSNIFIRASSTDSLKCLFDPLDEDDGWEFSLALLALQLSQLTQHIFNYTYMWCK